MAHDFQGKDSDHARTDYRGKKCYGYMDYNDDTNYWSRCSVEDFTKTKKSCLAGGTGGGGGNNWKYLCSTKNLILL